MITFRCGPAPKNATIQTGRGSPGIKRFTVEKGDPVLKILFSDDDIHISRSGRQHLDIWGRKLEQLARLLQGKEVL